MGLLCSENAPGGFPCGKQTRFCTESWGCSAKEGCDPVCVARGGGRWSQSEASREAQGEKSAGFVLASALVNLILA